MSDAYRLKTIDFLGRRVPVVVQNENGPCPMLALANVLLLRNQIHLSPDAPDVTQERLLSLIAGHLLDVNSKQDINEEQQANMMQNIADAVELLPKLTTGIDVNIIFNDVRGFEYTDAIAIFDLLDIQLVHGWLVDPQDRDTAAAIGSRSYNALTERIVVLKGRSSLTPAPSQETGGPAPPQDGLPLSAAEASSESVAEESSSAKVDAGARENVPGQLIASAATPLGKETHPDEGKAHTDGAEETANPASTAQQGLGSAPGPDGDHAVVEEGGAGSKTSSTPHSAHEVAATSEGGKSGKGIPSEGLSEADELDFALKLSLDNPGKDTAASFQRPVSSPGGGMGEGLQALVDPQQPPPTKKPPAGSASTGADLISFSETSEPASEAGGAGMPAKQPFKGSGAEGLTSVTAVHIDQAKPSSSLQPTKPHEPKETVDQGFVVIEPEEAPGAGFEQVSMPTLPSSSPDDFQELKQRPAHSADTLQQPDIHSKTDTRSAAETLPEEELPRTAMPPGSQKDSGMPETGRADGITAQGLRSETGTTVADSPEQKYSVLDGAALALLAALPEPASAEGLNGGGSQPSMPENAVRSQEKAGLQEQPALACASSPAAAGPGSASPGKEADAPPDIPVDNEEGITEADSLEKPGMPDKGVSGQQQACSMGSNKEAYLIQSFLDNASSQLTEHGLISLHQGLKPRQLAVLFRNNHFNTLFKFEDALYLLVTDQGYLHEQDAVWEKLDTIDGNTVYVGSQIRRPDPVADTSASDLQLAMQLQQQEDEEHQQRMAAQQQRQQAQQQAQEQGQPQQRAPEQAARPGGPAAQAPGRGSRHRPGPPQARHRHGRGAYESRRSRHGHAAQASGRDSRDCTIM